MSGFIGTSRPRQLAVFLLRHLVGVQGRREAADGGGPVGPDAGVSGLHRAPGVHTRPPGRRAELLDDVLAEPVLGVRAQALEHPADSGVAERPG
jgi:hypothetical protein